MANKNVVVFGCKNTTRYLINSLHLQLKISYIITISNEKNNKLNVPDFSDLTDLSIKLKIPIYYCNKYSLQNKQDISFLKSLNIDIAFVIGWQRLIPEDLLKNVKVGFFGMHGSAANLPKGRGRSPMNWAIIEGRKHFYTNLFKYSPGIDDGDIVDTVKFSITNEDTAETMHYKNMISMRFLIQKNLISLINNKVTCIPQKSTTPSYYPKRNEDDSLIDWELDIYKLQRFIRAVTKPFNGAFTFLNNNKFIIFDAQIFDLFDFDYTNEDNGKILEVFESGKFLVKCNGGVLLVNNYSFDDKFEKGNIFNNYNHVLNLFQINSHGFFDF
jgi:methionyl-tRNA formyltransferase